MKPLVMVLGLTAVVLVALGLLLGFRPLTDAAGYKCGSAFRESGDLYVDQLTDTMMGGTGESTCDQERSDALPMPAVLLGLGVLAGVSAAIVRRSQVDLGGESPAAKAV